MEEEAAWQIAVRDIKRYEVAVAHGERLVKAKHRAPRKKQKQNLVVSLQFLYKNRFR